MDVPGLDSMGNLDDMLDDNGDDAGTVFTYFYYLSGAQNRKYSGKGA